ncbi:MAG: single-stranded-DNA-specific exonuclease RecJ [Thermodesulfobacteria bacterium]|nr:single-stranded-DNA-specific exonuclease RecJ [Thermodesulfobacteriota bacterium]
MANSLDLPRSITAFLVNRGLCTRQSIEDHLHSSLSSLTDPFVMKDMDKAVDRLATAVTTGEKIGIFGDFDADGVTAAALLYLFLKEIGAKSEVYIPHREKDGYGLNEQGIDQLASSGCSLIVSVDCGITNVQEAAYLSSKGLELIITDHHQPLEEMPQAIARVNPKRKDCPFPFKELSGVGVAFYLSWALRRRLIERGRFSKSGAPNLKKYLGLVAVGTVADMMPLYRENRVMVKAGLEVLSRAPGPGLKAIMASAGVSGKINCTDIGFRIGPRLNAAGRMHHAMTAFELLTCQDEKEASRLASELEGFNQARQKLERRLLSQVLDMLKTSGDRCAHVFYSDTWKKGILGLVASKVVEQAKCPVILLALDEGGFLAGSGRSPDEIDLFSAISACQDLFLRFGGHRTAAGLKMPLDNIEEFQRRFEEAVQAQALEKATPCVLELDMEVSMEELVTPRYVKCMEWLEPFGPGYQEPVFSTRNFSVREARVVGKNHLKLLISPVNGSVAPTTVSLLAWGHGSLLDLAWHEMEVAFSPSVNEWNGKKSLQLILKDARRAPGGQVTRKT